MTVREAVIQVVTDLVRVTLIVRDGVPVTHRLVVANREAGIVVRGVKVRDKLTVLETDRVKLTDIVRVARIVMTVREAVIQVVTDLVRVTLIVRDGVPVTHWLVVANREAGIVVRGVKVRDKLTVLDGVPVTHLE